MLPGISSRMTLLGPNSAQGAARLEPVRRTTEVAHHVEALPAVVSTNAQMDRVAFSADAKGLNNLLRTWGALSQLFGKGGKGVPAPYPDLSALREALQQAQRNAAELRSRQGVIDTLKSSALEQAASLVERYYGIQGDGAKLQVVLEEDMGGALASVSYLYDRNGRMTDQRLHVSVNQFKPDSGPNGVNAHVIENDRIIAHEMTHAIMGRNMDMRDLPDWFAEGTAEYISGGAERVGLALQRLTPRHLLNRLMQPWQGDSAQYAAGYLAVRYLDIAAAQGGGLRGIMGELKGGASLDDAIAKVSGGSFGTTSDFLRHFVRDGAGEAFLQGIDTSGRDPGSIKPGRGPDIVPDQGMKSNQPVKGFQMQWPSPLEGIKVNTPVPWFGQVPASTAAAAYRRQQIGG